MSISHSPRLNDIRRREEIADRNRVAGVISIFVALGLIAMGVAIWVPVIAR